MHLRKQKYLLSKSQNDFYHSDKFYDIPYNVRLPQRHKISKYTEVQKVNSLVQQANLRFVQVSLPLEQIPFISAIADTEFSSQFKAINVIEGQEWRSQLTTQLNSIDNWLGMFTHMHRINEMDINFLMSPQEIKIEISDDAILWSVAIDWQICNPALKDAISVLDTKSNPGQALNMEKHKKFYKKIIFEQPIQFKFIKINLKGFVFGYVSIDSIKAFSQDYIVQIRNMYQKERNECLAVLNGNFTIGNQVVSQDCVRSIVAGDDRELFILKPNQQIQTLVGKLCLTVDSLHQKAKVILDHCGEAVNKGDLREQWEIYESGYIKSIMDNQYCLENNNEEINQINGIKVTANSTQTNSDANFVFIQDLFWTSWPGHHFVKFEISFDISSLEKMVINWKHTPKSFEIHVLQGKYWRTIEEEEENQAVQFTVELNSQKYSGIRIIMKDTKQTDSTGQVIYGIKDLQISTGSKSVFANNCVDKEGMSEIFFKKWQIFDVHFYDQKNEIQLDAEKQILYGKVQELVRMVGQIKVSGQYIPKLMNNAKQFKELISKMDEEFAIIEKQLQQFARKHYKPSFQQPMSLNGNIRKNPAKSCAEVLIQVPNKRSGFFWIKSDCMPNALRLYCDMQNDFQTFYYIGKTMRDDHFGLLKYNTVGDIRQECAEYGLDPVDLSSPLQMNTLIKYLKEISVTLDDKSMIPLAYDYGCDNKKCSLQWRSLKSSNSMDRSDMFKQFMNKRDKDDNVQKAISQNEQHNVLGFGLAIGGLSTFKLGEDGQQYPVKGMLCSLNKLEDKITELTCDSIPRGQNIFDGGFGKNFKVYCPPGCATYETSVFGSLVYTDESSICRAGIHNGVIDDKGGYMILGMEEGKVYYEGSENNKIKTLEFQKPWDRSFIVDYFKILCPIDKLPPTTKATSTSFIEKSEIINGIDADGKKYKFVQTQKEDPNELGTQQTDKMLEKLNKIMEGEFHALQKQNSIGIKVKALAEEVLQELGVMIDGDMSAKELNLNLKESEEFQEGLSQAMTESIQAANEKSVTMKRQKVDYIKKLHQMNKNVGYNETYAQSFEDHWDVFDSPLVENMTVSQWKFSVESIQPHKKAITQTKEMDIREEGKYGTFITLKEKEYYDGQFQMSFKLGSDGCVGMIFRYMDPFNYYSFDICRGDSKQKRFLRIKDGQSTVLNKIEDGGVMQQLWYRVIVKIENNKFQAYVSEELPEWADEEFISSDELELVLETNDAYFSQGTIGVAINKALGVNFDKISYIPLDCFLKIPDTMVYVPQDSNRWQETFRTDIGLVWEPYDSQFQINGPSRWNFKSRVMDQLNVVAQSSGVYSVEDELPALLKLKLNKYALYGVQETFILANEKDFTEQKMYIGIAFKLVSKFEYLSFEVGENICRIRKYYANFNPDDKRDVIVEELVKSDCSIKVLTWYRVLVIIDQNQNIDIKLGHNDIMKTVLSFKYVPEKDKMEHRGTIGLLTHKCKAYFTHIKMGPADEFEIPDDPIPEKKVSHQDEQEEEEEENDPCDALNPIDSKENINGTQNKISLQGPTFVPPTKLIKAIKEVSKKIKYKLPQEKNKLKKNREPQQCWERIQPDDKYDFCISKYSEQNLIEICKENFNQICCDQSFEDNLKSHDCVKKCQNADKPKGLSYDLAVHCIDSKEKQPLYENCNHLYFNVNIIVCEQFNNRYQNFSITTKILQFIMRSLSESHLNTVHSKVQNFECTVILLVLFQAFQLRNYLKYFLQKDHEIANCKNHLCNLCCVEIDVVTNTSPDLQIQNQCAKKCDLTFPS